MADEFNFSSHTVFFERTFCVMYVTVYVLICKSKVRADALAIDDGALFLCSFRQTGVECRNYLWAETKAFSYVPCGTSQKGRGLAAADG